MFSRQIYTFFYTIIFINEVSALCNEYFNSELCAVDISCTDFFQTKYRSTNYYTTLNYINYINDVPQIFNEIERKCHKIQFNDDNNEYLPIHLEFIVNSNIYDVTEEIPVYENCRDCNDMNDLITNLDLHSNNYKFMPTLKEMKNLLYINLSNNKINIASLTNKYDLPELAEIDLSHNDIYEIDINQDEHKFTQLIKVNLCHNLLVSIPDAIFEPFKQLQVLDLSHNLIVTLNQLTFEGTKKLTHLDISHNKISDLNSSLFRNKELKVLNSSFNELTNIKATDFKTLNKMEVMELSNNFIINVEKDVFGHMTLLQSAFLNNNSIKHIDKDVFQNASLLTDVNISNNELKTIPKGMFKSKSIHYFSIADNKLEGSLERNMFNGLTFVKRINLSCQYLDSVEDDAFMGLANVEVILLNNNNLKVLSQNSFRNVEKLIILDLSFNKIDNLGFEKSGLYSLRTLYLSYNDIAVVTQNNFNGLNGLQFLDLSNNKISQLEIDSFVSLNELIYFEISNNPLSGVLKKNTFDGLKSLPILDISCTSLVSIQNSSFNGMNQLKSLNVSYGKIKMIEYNIFINTGNIKTVDLSHNKIEQFFINSTELSQLEILYLNNNYIKALNSDTFGVLGRLITLSLSYNLVEYIPSETFSNLKILRELDLSYNPLSASSLLHETQIIDSLNLSGIRILSLNNMKDISIKQLIISNSSVTDMKKLHVSGLKRLDILILSNNKISKLVNEGLTNLTDLKLLDLSHNEIAFIQPGAFKDNTLLHTLNVSHNFITDIPYGVFHGLTKLHTIDISFNHIQDLVEETFLEATELSEIIADHNKIESISPEEFSSMNLKILSIGDNPIPCNVLVNLRRSASYHVTARKLDHTNDYNVHGMVCAKKSNIPNILANVSFNSTDNTKILLNIRDILLNRFSSNEISSGDHDEKDNVILENINQNIERLTEVMNRSFQNTAKPKLNDDTDVILQKMLKVLTLISARQAPTIDVAKGNVTNDNLIAYINKVKQDLEANLAFEKDGILDEMRNKLAALKAQYDVIGRPTTDAILQKNRGTTNESKSYFTETCVGLILLILVCFVLFVIYKSGVFARSQFSISTRELPGAIDSSL